MYYSLFTRHLFFGISDENGKAKSCSQRGNRTFSVFVLPFQFLLRLNWRRARKIAKSDQALFLSVRQLGTNRLPLGGFSWNLISEYFSKICRENLIFNKICKEEQLNFMVTPCINNIQHFNIQLTHTTLKRRRVIKTF